MDKVPATSFFWFRRDLRLHDNAALWHALQNENNVTLLFIFDTEIINELPADDARISFIYNCLKDINTRLNHLGASLLVKKGTPLHVWKVLNEEYQIQSVYINKDYEPYAIQRDREIEEFLNAQGIALKAFKDQVVYDPDEIVTNQGKPYSVFTPFKNKWLSRYLQEKPGAYDISDYGNLSKQHYSFPSLKSIGFSPSQIKVADYNLSNLEAYEMNRDYPAGEATSLLGPHLRFGTVGIRGILMKVSNQNLTFLSELIWREFFKQILYHFPEVVTRNFYRKYDGIAWRNDEAEFNAWANGQTGFPLVDAGIRQLNASGYMHNRVRMVAAGFLCKHLLIDWRYGEAYFAGKLLDYDLSSNNGNWQWAAGTGCDAAPYFRVFNPETQMRKFDCDARYVKTWIPEYGTPAYVKPIVDHVEARNRAIAVYREALNRYNP